MTGTYVISIPTLQENVSPYYNKVEETLKDSSKTISATVEQVNFLYLKKHSDMLKSYANSRTSYVGYTS